MRSREVGACIVHETWKVFHPSG